MSDSGQKKDTNRSSHDKGWICAILTSFFIFIGSVSFVFATNYYGIFGNTIRDVSNNPTYNLLITPASKAFSIWGAIYSLLLCVHLYSLVTICREGKVGYLYRSPGMISKRLLLLLSLSYLTSAGWQTLFLLHAEVKSMVYSAVALVAVAILNYLALTNSQARNHRAMIHNAPPLSLVSKKENVLYQMLVVNSIALYFGWTLIAANLSVGIALQEHMLKTISGGSIYEKKVEVASLILILLTVCIAVYTILDFSMLNMTSFTVLQYVSIMVGLVGIFYGDENQTSFAYEGKPITETTLYNEVSTFPKKQFTTILISLIAVYGGVKFTLCFFSCIKYVKRSI
ncbi:MAG: hypothetical protein MHMPM18_000419 [Marteilia pararefringens]